ncbi:hypothetical protein ES689_07975 [Frigoribacterium sp. ACAM 257]|uniref:hypothetical protein n=1 Tax=Frigoribacterium sp. ACAM 257 TaxID=2508998 RepID=UPI0011B9A2D2|nr:hypothetical protein [Frigoribacterium sp. ACAM 257]TWX38558.1 hypothetical protein ES689_07975 [Frigoribacterium sp. ACAM 257]
MRKTTGRAAALSGAMALAAVLAVTPAVHASATTAAPAPTPTTWSTDVRPGPEATASVPDRDAGAGDERSIYRYRIVNAQVTANAPGKLPIAKCAAASDETSCTISAGVSTTATVGISLGVSAQAVVQGLGPTITGGFNASSSLTVTMNVGCSAPPLRKGQAFAAFAVGTRVTYQVQKTNVFTGKKILSNELSAFFPEANGIACGII